jgi:hypothetical protein
MSDPIRRKRSTNRVTRPLVNELLTAINEALTVPIPDSYDDRDAAAFTLRARAAFVRGALESYVGNPSFHLESLAATVRTAAPHWPATYRPYGEADGTEEPAAEAVPA